jgi:hypothetical protein
VRIARALLLPLLLLGLTACAEAVEPPGAADAALALDGAPSSADARALADSGAADSGVADAATDDATTPDDATTEDAAMPPVPVHAYGALGSSSTAGAGASRPERGYVPLLHARLGAHPRGAGGVLLVNRGQGGARIDQLLAALPALETERPEVVTILPLSDFVSTDPARFRSGYDELFRRLGAVGATVYFGDLRIDPTYLCQGGRSGPGGCYGEQDRALLASKNAVIAELAPLHPHVVVVPVFDQNAAHPEWNAADGHPNDLGHQYLADTFWAAIAARL